MKTLVWVAHALPLLTLLLLLCQIGLQYRVDHIHKDGRTIQHRKSRKWLLWVACAIVVLGFIANLIADHQKDKKDAERDNRQVAIQASQARLQGTLDRYGSVMATNSAIDPQTRAAIAQVQNDVEQLNTDIVDMAAWKTEWRTKNTVLLNRDEVAKRQAAERTAEQSAKNMAVCRPVFEYTLDTLKSYLRQLAQQRGQEVFSSYAGIAPSTNNTQWLGMMRVGTNTQAGFSFRLQPLASRLLIISTNSIGRCNLVIQIQGGEKVTVSLAPTGSPVIEELASITEYKATVDRMLRYLLVAHDQSAETNKAASP